MRSKRADRESVEGCHDDNISEYGRSFGRERFSDTTQHSAEEALA